MQSNNDKANERKESPEIVEIFNRTFVAQPSATADARILAYAAQSMLRSQSAPVVSSNALLVDAVNDAIFELIPIRLKAAASNTKANRSRMTHVVDNVEYGEIEFIQFDNEIDITYRLLPRYLDQLAGCAVRIRVNNMLFDLGRLDAEGKAGETVPIGDIPIECECQFLRPIDN